MTPAQFTRREALLARSDVALDRWPQRIGQNFVREMTAVTEGLEALAREVDAAQDDRLERSRNWRYVGNAYFDLANSKDLDLLKLAADAYRKAEELLAGTDNAIEKMKLDYSYGHALFHLSDAKDLALVQEARRRYASALEIARAEMPAGIEPANTALANADRVIALLTQAEGLSLRISELDKQKEALDAEEGAAPESVPDDAALFGKLLDVYNKDVAAGKVSDTRQQALDPVLSQLGSLLQTSPEDAAGMGTQISRMLDLARSMSHLTGTSQDASTLPVDSRADAVWKRFSRLKLSLSGDLMHQRGGSEAQFSGIEIFKRCGYAYTFLHQPGRDDDTVRSYETDVLRQLACEVRAFSLRDHLTLASPLWPSPPSPQDPNAVFFSGGDVLRELLAELCAKQKLKLLAQAALKDFASARWDQVRACCVALFDFTGYARPDPNRPIDLADTGPIAAVSYELGLALTLGRPVIVLANEGQYLPFDVDIEPIRLKGDGRDDVRLTDTIDDAIYGLQRGGEESSIAATLAYLNERFSGTQNFIVEQLLKLIDDEVVRDPVKFRRFVEPVLGRAMPDAPQMLFPAWPGSYPRPGLRRCFHVTAFGPAWAEETMKIVVAACKTAKPRVEYIRGDQVLDPDITRSIWDNLCQASHVVVDLTGLNANVALELGIAHTLGRNVLLVTQDSGKKGFFPSIAKVRMHRYSVTGDPGLKPLRHALDQFLAR
jgi:hypothetical protein